MITIYKYELNIGETEIEVPEAFHVLTVAFQGDQLCIWAILDTESDKSKFKRRFAVYGTGHIVRDNIGWSNYIGTAFSGDGLVFHVFEF